MGIHNSLIRRNSANHALLAFFVCTITLSTALCLPPQTVGAVAVSDSERVHPGSAGQNAGDTLFLREEGRACSTGLASEGMTWNQATMAAPWQRRKRPGLAIFNNEMWIIGGYYEREPPPVAYVQDAWSSTDGQTWVKRTSSVRGENALVYDGKLWALGWYVTHWTSDGQTWTEIATGASAYCRAEGVFAGKMWLIGGVDYNPDGADWYLDVSYLSTDGAQWLWRSAPWGQRVGAVSLVFNGKLWVLAGGPTGVWYTSDGDTWQEAAANAPWGARYFAAGVVADGKMWILGGNRSIDNNGAFLNDVWCSSDGVNWTQVTPAAPWSPRSNHRAVVYKNKLWVMAGVAQGNTLLNDVWNSDLPPPPPLTVTQSPRGGWVEASNPWTLSTAASGGTGPITYQWKKDNADIPSATDATYDIASLALTDTGWYVCEITDSAKTTVTTSPAYLEVFPYDSLPASGPVALALTTAGCLLLTLFRNRRGRHMGR